MRRPVAAILVAALALSVPAPASAYLKFGVEIDSTVREVKWNGAIRYFVTERAVAGVSPSAFRDTIRRAFAQHDVAIADGGVLYFSA